MTLFNLKYITAGIVLVGTLMFTNSQAAVPETAYADLHWRQVGPFRGGWATAVAGHPDKITTFYFGSADGGVWKTDNAGVTWKPLFEQQGSASIGALAIRPEQPGRDLGGYRPDSASAGISLTAMVFTVPPMADRTGNMWVSATRAISVICGLTRTMTKLRVVAALGHVFGPNQQRGLFRTEDGGESWQQVLYLDDTTGAADLAYSADAPAILYASLWQVQRHPWLDYFQPTVGGNSSIWRSTDGGRNWVGCGWGRSCRPTPLSRIEIAVAPGSPGAACVGFCRNCRRWWSLPL